MTREEVLEQWPEWESHRTYKSLCLEEAQYTAARSALLRVAELEQENYLLHQANGKVESRNMELEEKNRKLVELCKTLIAGYTSPEWNEQLEQLTKE